MSNLRHIRPIPGEMEVQGFSEWDDAQMRELFGDRLWKAAQNLLIAQSQLERTAGSFGLAPDRALAILRQDLKKFREACIEQLKDNQ